MLQYSPKIVTDSLVMCLDPSQNKSYPTDLPVKDGLIMWMDAADDTTFSYSTGTTVSQWRDKSGFNYHMSPPSSGPTRSTSQNSRKVVAFTTTQNIQNSTIDLRNSAYSVFIVDRYTNASSGTGRILTSNSSYNNWLLGHWASETNKYYGNGWVYQTYAAADTNWKLYLGDWGGPSNDSANFYATGTALATNSTGANAGPWYLGVNIYGAELSNCEVAEIVVFNRLLSATERRLVHTYLGQKWGILNTDRSIIDLAGNDDNGLLGNGTTANIPAYDYYNTSLRFDGTNDYIFLNNSQLNISTSITVEAWVKYNAQGGYNARSYSVITCKGYPWTWLLEDQSGQFNFRISTSVTADSNVNSSYSHGLNSWNHVVGTYDGVTQKIYVNGVLQSSTSLTGTINTSSNDAMIGCYNYGDYCLTGNVGAVRVYSRALNTTEILQNYEAQKSKFTNTIIQQGLVLNLDAGNPYSYAGAGTTWYDVSGNNYNGTLTNSPTYSTDNSGLISFNGSSQYIDCGNVLASLTNLTLECFVKFGTQSALYGGIISKTLSNADGWEIRVGASTSTTTDLQFRYVGDNAAIGFNTSFNNGTWYHIAVTGANGSQKAYINGVQFASGTTALSPSANTNSLLIGKLAYSGYYVNMLLGYARIYNRVLSAAEVLQNYNATKDRFGL